MASFSFGAGNAGKLLRVPVYLLGALATVCIPRTRRRWVFGSAVGPVDGGRALQLVAAAHGEDIVWLTGGAAEAGAATALGIRNAPRGGLRGFWLTARARVVVLTHGFGDVNRYAARGAFVVQLWHGIPLKRIGLDSPETVRSPVPALDAILRPVLTALYRRTQRRISVLPAASHLVRGRLESAFALTERAVPVTGEPRTDVLLRTDRVAARTELAARTGTIAPATRGVLYAPTWRDGEPDPAVPSAAEWERLLEALEAHDAVLWVRSHPLGAGEYRPPRPTARVRMLGSDVAPDVTGLLPAFDVLITDYSSLVYDSAYVPLAVVLLAPDLETYRARRGFYGTYEMLSGGRHARDWTGATAALTAILGDDDERERALARSRSLHEQVHAFADGKSAERVYRVIDDRLRGSRS